MLGSLEHRNKSKFGRTDDKGQLNILYATPTLISSIIRPNKLYLYSTDPLTFHQFKCQHVVPEFPLRLYLSGARSILLLLSHGLASLLFIPLNSAINVIAAMQ